jgi:ABC-type nitrate/sulfonate/bicarbonate transport system ATPase subunit
MLLEISNLSALKDTVSAHLTYSDRRLVEIARAIAAQPGLALLDEPLAGLNPAETETIMAVIQDIRSLRGISIIRIEHKMECETLRVRLHFGARRPMSGHDFTKCGHLAVTALDRYRAARMEHTPAGRIDGAGNLALHA